MAWQEPREQDVARARETRVRRVQFARGMSLRERLAKWLRGARDADDEAALQAGTLWFRFGLLLLLVGIWLPVPFFQAVACGCLAFAAVGWLWDRLSVVNLEYRRHFSEQRAFLGETIRLTLEVHNRKVLPLSWLEIVDSAPFALHQTDEAFKADPVARTAELRTFWRPNVLQRVTREYAIPCVQRGYHVYGPARLRTGDGFGLFRRSVRLSGPQVVIVYPRLYTALELRLPAKNPFGVAASKAQLLEDPLRTAGVREWQPADRLRQIHWKATARHQRLLSRFYQPSEEPQVLVFLNAATLPRYWEGYVTVLLERAISVAGSLAALCIEQCLPVGLIANAYWPGSDQTLRLLPGRSPQQFMRILELLAAVTPYASRPLEELLLREGPALPWGATLLVVTPIAHEALLTAIRDLARSGRKVVLFTLAEKPPESLLPGILVYHLPHLIEDLVAPQEVL